MKAYLGIALRALVITIVAAGIGVAINLFSPRIPWVYQPRTEAIVGEVRVPFIDEQKAKEFSNDPRTIFIDARTEQDYQDGHIRGALSLPEPDLEARFPEMGHLLPEDARIILYCSGPDCDMAEKVATFLAKMGQRHLMIMSAGYYAWKAAGFPVEGP